MQKVIWSLDRAGNGTFPPAAAAGNHSSRPGNMVRMWTSNAEHKQIQPLLRAELFIDVVERLRLRGIVKFEFLLLLL